MIVIKESSVWILLLLNVLPVGVFQPVNAYSVGKSGFT